MRKLTKMSLTDLIAYQLKVFCKHGNCKLFKLIDSEISRRVVNSYTL